VRALLDAKADVNARKADGGTALIVASEKGHKDVVKALIGAKADVSAKATGGTALFLATKHGFTEVARMLKQAGAKS